LYAYQIFSQILGQTYDIVETSPYAMEWISFNSAIAYQIYSQIVGQMYDIVERHLNWMFITTRDIFNDFWSSGTKDLREFCFNIGFQEM
jgi:hypothetical protein